MRGDLLPGEAWLYYNTDDDCYYSADGKVCGAELAAAKMHWPPRSDLSDGMETFKGRKAIRKVIRDTNRGRRVSK